LIVIVITVTIIIIIITITITIIILILTMITKNIFWLCVYCLWVSGFQTECALHALQSYAC